MKTDNSKIYILMDQEFTQFDLSKRKKFIKDLSVIAGCRTQQIENISFEQGCVICRCEMPKLAAEMVEYYFKRYKGLSEEDKTIPSNKEIIQFFEKRYKITQLHCSHCKLVIVKQLEKENDKNAIMFVHGWRGDEHSFGKLPEFLQNNTNCIPLIYKYPSGLWEQSPSIFELANGLETWIRDNHLSDKRRFAIIAHSMGGIIVRKVFANQLQRGEDKLDFFLKHITFVASPYTGVSLAKLGKIVPAIQKAQIQDLDADSSTLVDINSQWRSWLEMNLDLRRFIRSIYGTSDNIVSKSAATADDSQAVAILNADHTSIIKPKSIDEPIVETVTRFYRECELSVPT
ncbi:MAG: hypothetical protein ABJN57_09420 [Hyphomicrobiales bacterium]